MKDCFITGESLSNQIGLKQPYIERVLGLPQRSLSIKKFLELPETQIILKIIMTYPWILEVADHNFDQNKANLILCREYFSLKIKEDGSP